MFRTEERNIGTKPYWRKETRELPGWWLPRCEHCSANRFDRLRQYIAFGMNKTGTEGAEANGSAVAGAAPFATPIMSGQVPPATGLSSQGHELPLAVGDRGLSDPSTSQEMMRQASIATSPAGLLESNWSTDSLRDLNLSGRAPRIFPGMVTRRQRSSSTRQGEEPNPAPGVDVSPDAAA